MNLFVWLLADAGDGSIFFAWICLVHAFARITSAAVKSSAACSDLRCSHHYMLACDVARERHMQVTRTSWLRFYSEHTDVNLL